MIVGMMCNELFMSDLCHCTSTINYDAQLYNSLADDIQTFVGFWSWHGHGTSE